MTGLPTILSVLLLLAPACTVYQSRFVDIQRPRATITAELEAYAAAHNARQEAELERNVEDATHLSAADTERVTEIDRQMATLRAQKREHLKKRLEVATALEANFQEYTEGCQDLTRLEIGVDCDAVQRILALAREARVSVRHSLEAATSQSDSSQAPGSKDPLDTPPASVDIRFPKDMTEEQAQQLLGPSAEELAVDERLGALALERTELGRARPLQATKLSVNYGTLEVQRLTTRMDLRGRVDKGQIESTRYRSFAIDGVTRFIAEGVFEDEAMDALGIPDGQRACLSAADVSGLVVCPRDDPRSGVVQTGALRAYDQPRSGARPVGVESVVYGGIDPLLGAVVGVGLGAHGGLQWRSPVTGAGRFSRWKLALMAGGQLDVLVNLSREDDEPSRFVGAITPSLVLRVARSEVFHATPDKFVETGRTVSMDITGGISFDTSSRMALSLSSTIRPVSDTYGLHVRWNRYFDGRGNAIVAGIEFDDEGAQIPAAGAVVVAVVAAVVLVVNAVYDCETDPDCQ